MAARWPKLWPKLWLKLYRDAAPDHRKRLGDMAWGEGCEHGSPGRMARFPGRGNEAFRRALHSWARALWEHKTGGSGFPAFEELERTKGAVMATVAEAAWDRWDAKVRAEAFEQGVARGIESGIRQGGARLITRQAALKFGGGTAERLRGLLEGLTTQEDLDRVGGLILECGDSRELLSRVSNLLKEKRG